VITVAVDRVHVVSVTLIERMILNAYAVASEMKVGRTGAGGRRHVQ
jgi:hypothetical protein